MRGDPGGRARGRLAAAAVAGGRSARSGGPALRPRHRLLPVRERARLRGHRGGGRGGPGERRRPRAPGRGGPRLRPHRQSRRRAQPDRGQRAPGDQPDAQGVGDLRRRRRDQLSTGPPIPILTFRGGAGRGGHRPHRPPRTSRRSGRGSRRPVPSPPPSPTPSSTPRACASARCRSRPRASARSSPAHEPSSRPQPGALRVEQLPAAAPHHRPRRHRHLRDARRRRRLLQARLHARRRASAGVRSAATRSPGRCGWTARGPATPWWSRSSR